MYHSRFFFARLASALGPVLRGCRLTDCYSQQKDELMLLFLNPEGGEFSIRADLSQGVSILSFPRDAGRSRSNSVSLFPEIQGRRVEEVEAVPDDRLFRLRFEGGLRLSFKMYGNRSNLILHDEEKVLSVFNHHLRKDLEGIPAPARPLPHEFEWHPDPEELRRRCPGLTKRMWQYWNEISSALPEVQKARKFGEMLDALHGKEALFVCREEDEAFVSFFPMGEILFESHDILEIANRYYRFFWQVNHFGKEKRSLLKELRQGLVQALERIQLLEHQVLKSMEESGFRLQADLLMAYGQSLPSGLEKVSLPAFDGSGEVEILLKKDLSISQNAERFYKKARGRQGDLDRIRAGLEEWKQRAAQMRRDLSDLEDAPDLKSLRRFQAARPSAKPESGESDLPFHLISFMQYEIRVGKNARGNDELLRISHKDDYWLHARDVPGSHVLVRHKKGMKTPAPVLEKAAELAAFYSKARNEGLCPVMLTERKYVRKLKGGAPGQVKVEREKTLLVKPGN